MDFNPRTPCGVRQVPGIVTAVVWEFQSTHPLRGATFGLNRLRDFMRISIHAPLAGCDARCAPLRTRSAISIHAPLAGCDPAVLHHYGQRLHFNPRTPCGVRRTAGYENDGIFDISIHAPLAGCDRPRRGGIGAVRDFNPRTPCGVRQGKAAYENRDYTISIHAPLAGCDDILGGL